MPAGARDLNRLQKPRPATQWARGFFSGGKMASPPSRTEVKIKWCSAPSMGRENVIFIGLQFKSPYTEIRKGLALS
jgi:hypothetical protein